MPGKKNRSLKKPDMYEDLRDEGASKEKAARVSNAAAKEGTSTVSKRGGKSGSYDDHTASELKKRAKELGIKNYSGKKKADLIKALRNN